MRYTIEKLVKICQDVIYSERGRKSVNVSGISQSDNVLPQKMVLNFGTLIGKGDFILCFFRKFIQKIGDGSGKIGVKHQFPFVEYFIFYAIFFSQVGSVVK
jgi:hypothetical protein